MLFYIKLFRANSLDDIVAITDKYVFHGELEKIIEVTYSYRDIEPPYILNETLFEEYLNLSYPKNDLGYLGRKYRYKIQVQLVYIEDILKKVQKIKILSRSESLRRGIFVDALEYVKKILEISVYALEFELQKGGIKHHLSPAKIKKKVREIEKREREVFGPKVIESTEEFSFCYNFVTKNHEAKKKSLSEADKKAMKRYLKIIKDSRKCDIIETPDVQKKLLRGSFLKKEISRKDYRKIFDRVCEMYGLPQRTKITNAGSIYDGDNFLEIPRSNSFAYFTIERLLKLLSHEIESHYINSYNGRLLLGNFRGAKNLPKEEGLAMFMEKIFHGYSYENIDNIVEYFFTIMAGECLEGHDFKEFMRIMGREYKCKRSYFPAVVRAKRNYSPEYPGVQHKDVVYFRGLTQTVEYLKEGGEFWKLFLGKVGFHDLEHIHDIYQSYEEKEKLVYPIFISDLIYYYLTEKEKDQDFEFQAPEYYLYLKKKYWFLGIESFKIIDHINAEWKKIERIIKMFEKAILEAE